MSPTLPAFPTLPGLSGPEAAAFLGGLGVLTAFLGLYLLIVPYILDRRIALFVGQYRRAASPAAAELGQGTPDAMAVLERRLMRRKASASVRALLLRAGLQITVSEFVALRLVAAFVVGGFAALLLVPRLGTLVGLVLAAAAALAGSYLPISFVRIRASRRLAALERQLPDALDLAAASLQAGSGLGQAFDLIAREMPPPISEEFQRVMREVGLGLSLNEALANLAERAGSEDLDLVVTAINIQSRIGGNLVQVLRTITTTIRERIRIKGEIRVLTSQQRLSAIVISALPPALAVLLFVMNPKYMGRLFEPGVTRCMLVAGIVMMVAGIFSLRKITEIEV